MTVVPPLTGRGYSGERVSSAVPSNEEAARLLTEIADLLDVLGERFKPDAYRRAARSIEGLGEELTEYARRGELDQIPGVGDAIAEKLREYLTEGRIPYRDRLAGEIPPGIVALLALPGLGPKTARRFWTELHLNGPEELAEAIDAGRLVGVRGFGPTKIRQIRDALRTIGPVRRIPILEATEIAERLVLGLRAAAGVGRVEVAGSFRRGRETVGDLDLLATSEAPEPVFDAFERLGDVATIRLRGPTKETVVLRSGLQVDLRIVAPESYGAALQYFTGSKDHNIHLRTRARDLGLKINEYGVYRGEERVAGATEASVYEALGLREMPPELRENHGEIEASERGELPALLPYDGIRGELHLHVDGGADGPSALGALQATARRAGHRYVGVVLPSSVRDPAPWRAAADALPPEPRVLLAEEGSAERIGSAVPDGVDYRLLAGDSGGTPPPAGADLPGLLGIVHLPTSASDRAESDPARFGPWVRWAAARAAALELPATASRDGLDSGAARAALAQGARLLVTGRSTGLDAVALGVAIKLARRAGATVGSVVNAGEPPFGVPLTAPRSTPARRPRRTARSRG